MIKDANWSDEQVELLRRCCQIQIESLMRLAMNSAVLADRMNRDSIGTNEDEVHEIILEHIEQFEKIQDNPHAVFMFDKKHRDMIEWILLHEIDEFDGDAELNGIYAKFFGLKDLQKFTNQN